MSALQVSPATADPPARATVAETLDRMLAPRMFFLAVGMLILAAGVIHRLSHGEFTAFEATVLCWGLLLAWPIFVLEGMIRLILSRRPDMSCRQRVGAFLAVCVFPPLRLAGRAIADPDRIWLPGIGWSRVDHHLRGRLERFFSVPMIVVALLVLPFVAVEYLWLEQVRADFTLSLILDVGTSVIWLAFALELLVMVAVADSKFDYCLRHWIDLAIVLLPLVDFLPILRLFRLTGLLEMQQIGRLGRLYRLRGMLARIWRAVLLLEMIQRLLGHYPENRLVRLRKLLVIREEEVADLRKEIGELESTTVVRHDSAVAVSFAGLAPQADCHLGDEHDCSQERNRPEAQAADRR